jgi:hypothetical protein
VSLHTTEGEPFGALAKKNHDITECERKHEDIYVENGEAFCKEYTEGEPETKVYSFKLGW